MAYLSTYSASWADKMDSLRSKSRPGWLGGLRLALTLGAPRLALAWGALERQVTTIAAMKLLTPVARGSASTPNWPGSPKLGTHRKHEERPFRKAVQIS